MKNNNTVLAITLFATTSLFAPHHGGGRIGGLQSTNPIANAPYTTTPIAPTATTRRVDVRGESVTRPVRDYQKPEGTTTGTEFKKSPEAMNWNLTK